MKTAQSYNDHIVDYHEALGLEQDYGKILAFSITGVNLTILTENDNSISMHQMT